MDELAGERPVTRDHPCEKVVLLEGGELCEPRADVFGLGLSMSQRRTRLGRDADEIGIDSEERGKALERGTELGEPGRHGRLEIVVVGVPTLRA
jgi:hypothetical protein